MVDVTLRGTKGSPLTHDEVDANFTNLKNAVEANAADIATNAADIATNVADIATNVADIATNASSLAEAGGVSVYATIDDLPMSGNSNGDLALVSSTNRLYIFTNSGWYNIALVNQTPTISGNSAGYELALDGTPTVITLSATDPEGLPITWSHVATGLTNEATISNVDNVFTITPSTDTANTGDFSVTFRASDGVNIGTATSEFTLVFFSSYWKDAVLSIGTGSPQTFNYRYVKWNIRNNGGDAYTSAIEFELYDENDTKINISSASGPYYSTQTPDNLIDGVTTTGSFDKWSVDSSTAQIVFDLGSQRTIKTYRWATSNNVPERDPTSWTIEGSNDNSTWAVLHTVSDYSSTASRNTFNPTHGFGTAVNNSTFIDRSSNAHTVTTAGTPVQTAFHPYLDNWSYRNPENTALNVATSADFELGTDDWTIEFWVYPEVWSGAASIFLDFRTTGVQSVPVIQSSNGSNLTLYVNGSNLIIGTAPPLNDWAHIACTREGNTHRLFVNGQQTGSDYVGSQVYVQGAPTIGSYGPSPSTYDIIGNYSNVRIVKGTALYTANFTPPTKKLTAVSGTVLLTCQSNRFVDNSPSAHAITLVGAPEISAFNPFGQESEYAVGENKGSGYFDGSGDFLSLPNSAGSLAGVSAYTLEAWVYAKSLGDYAPIVMKWGTSAPREWQLYYGEGGNNKFTWIETNTGNIITTDTYTTLDEWAHLAVTYDGTTTRIFLNGVEGGSFSGTSISAASVPVQIGKSTRLSTDYYWDGYISDARIIDGTALYTANFTPPTAPVGNTNASLYLPFDNAGIYDKTGNNALTLVGNTATSTTQTKFADTAIYFDGSGDYLSVSYDPSLAVEGSPFTIEFWYYPTTFASSTVIYTTRLSSNSANRYEGIVIATQTDGTITPYMSSNNSSWGIVSGTSIGSPTLNAWNHIAIVRNGNNWTGYVNGTGTLFSTSSASVYDSSRNHIIGGDTDAAYVTGYIENFQVLKGVAKYTSNFTVPDKEQGEMYQAES